MPLVLSSPSQPSFLLALQTPILRRTPDSCWTNPRVTQTSRPGVDDLDTDTRTTLHEPATRFVQPHGIISCIEAKTLSPFQLGYRSQTDPAAGLQVESIDPSYGEPDMFQRCNQGVWSFSSASDAQHLPSTGILLLDEP